MLYQLNFEQRQRLALAQRRQRNPHLASGRSSWRGWFIILTYSALILLWLFYRLLWNPLWLANLPVIILELLELIEAAAFLTLVSLWVILPWKRLRPRLATTVTTSLPPSTVEELYALSPADFESYVADLFKRRGFKVKLRGRSGDMGVDLELAGPNGKRAIVQCKRYQHTVGAEIVRELYGTLIHERSMHAFLVTTADISDAAREWAANKPITLIDGATLIQIAAALHPTF